MLVALLRYLCVNVCVFVSVAAVSWLFAVSFIAILGVILPSALVIKFYSLLRLGIHVYQGK